MLISEMLKENSTTAPIKSTEPPAGSMTQLKSANFTHSLKKDLGCQTAIFVVHLILVWMNAVPLDRSNAYLSVQHDKLMFF